MKGAIEKKIPLSTQKLFFIWHLNLQYFTAFRVIWQHSENSSKRWAGSVLSNLPEAASESDNIK